MKKIFICILTLLLAMATLASCTNGAGTSEQTTTEGAGSTTTQDPNAGTTTTPGSNSTTSAPVEEEYPNSQGFDVLKIELSNYVELGNYKQNIINNVYCDDEELDARMKLLAEQEGYYTEVRDRLTAEGDRLNIDFQGRVEDVYFENGTAKGAVINLIDDNEYLEGFDADLYGIMPGTKVETKITFPEDYPTKALAGVEAVFEITVNYIYDYSFTDEKIKEITNGTYETVEAFAEAYRESIITSNVKNYEYLLSEKIFEMAMENCTIKSYPQELVDYWYNDTVYYLKQQAKTYGMSYENYLIAIGVTEEKILADAKEMAKEDLVLHAIFVAEGLTMSEAEYQVALTQFALDQGYTSAQTLEEQYGKLYMRGVIIKNLCLEHLQSIITVETDKAEYEHLVTDTSAETTEVTP